MKLKDLTCNQVWERCIEMWEWIVVQLQAGPHQSISSLKVEWLTEHGYPTHPDINSSCFFCGYSSGWSDDYCCDNCPARLIDSTFNCLGIEYQYNLKPGAFLLKIKELNERRLKDEM